LNYENSAFSLNCGPKYEVLNQYTTDVLLNKTLAYIKWVLACALHKAYPLALTYLPVCCVHAARQHRPLTSPG
jgi:hypothetical protein